jgi:hypothetical protein
MVLVGLILSFAGSILWLWPNILSPGWGYYNPIPEIALVMVGLIAIIFSSYYLGREWGLDKLLQAAFLPTLIFVLVEISGVSLTGGYSSIRSKSGAIGLFLYLPPFIFVVSLISASVAGFVRKRAMKRQEGLRGSKS